jgi:predicted RNA-binding protein with EMAP domain
MEISLKLEAPWTEVKEKLKEIVHSLTDEDLEYTLGQEEILLKRLAKKLDRSIGEIKAWIESVSFNKGKAS